MPFFMQNYDAPGPGVPKGEPQKPGILRYFIVLGRHFWDLVTLNVIYFITSLPAIFIYMGLGVFFFSSVLGKESALWVSLFFGLLMSALLGSGPSRAGAAYVLRNYSREEHAFLWSDFWEYFKKYFWKSIIIFIIDVVFVFILALDILFYMNLMKTPDYAFISLIAIYVSIFIFIIYILMHPYIYMQMVTFGASLKPIYKNSFLLAAIRLPQNLACTVAAIGIGYGIMELIGAWIPAMFIIFILFFSLICFLLDMNSFSVVKKYLIKD